MLHRLAVACVALALFAGFCATDAKADSTTIDNFVFTLSNGNTYTWTATVPPDIIPAGGTAFDLKDTSYTFQQGSGPIVDTSAMSIEFYTDAAAGGFVLTGGAGPGLFVDGPSLFEGSSPLAPVFNLGTFTNFTDFPDEGGSLGGSLTVTQTVVANTPEPSTLLLTGVGLLGILGIARKKKRFSLAA